MAITLTKKYYSIGEVRKLVYDNEVAVTTLVNYTHLGKIPSVKYNRKIFIPVWWVKEALENALHEEIVIKIKEGEN